MNIHNKSWLKKKMKTLREIKKILQDYKKELKEKYQIKKISIFGSYVRNQQKKRSDIDLLVEFEETPDLLKFIEIEEYLAKLIGVKVDLVRRPVLRKELRKQILKEAIEVYEKKL